MNPKQYAKSLRLVADFYESVPEDFPVPNGHLTKSLCFSSQDTKDTVRKIATVLGNCNKEYHNTVFELSKDFSGLCLQFYFGRESVCEKKVVGTREVPASYSPARQEEIVEWECSSVLEEKE